MSFINKKPQEVKQVDQLNKPHEGCKLAMQTSPSNFIELKGVEKSYTNSSLATKILKGIDLTIKEGEFVVVLGPSGSGKTTLMNIISGLDRATLGYVNVMGNNLINLDDDELTNFRRVNIGYIFQQYGLIPNLTVKENIEIGSFLKTKNEKQIEKEHARELKIIEEEFEKRQNQFVQGQIPDYVMPHLDCDIDDYIWISHFLLDKKLKKYILASNRSNVQLLSRYNQSLQYEKQVWTKQIGDKFQKINQKKNTASIEDIMKTLGIDQIANKYPNELSGGQQQRVSIARSFAKNPLLLFADEPTGAVDLEMSDVILNSFKQINKEFNTTILIVTHNPDIAKLATRVINFRDGYIVSNIEQQPQ